MTDRLISRLGAVVTACAITTDPTVIHAGGQPSYRVMTIVTLQSGTNVPGTLTGCSIAIMTIAAITSNSYMVHIGR